MARLALALIGLLAFCGLADAQQPAPPGMSLVEAAARRFPQPVPVEILLGRRVLQPRESQPTLGFVHDVVKQPDGSIAVIVDFGGIFGYFGRPIAVPLDAMALLGQYMEILDFTPQQLAAFKTFDPVGTTAVARDAVLRIGLAKPSH